MTAPMQKAINAAADALERSHDWAYPTVAARIAIVAAYPHLYQTLAKENRELRAEIARLKELLSPTQ
jgi:cell shape-determining protein MreC